MFINLIRRFWNNIQCRITMKQYECEQKSPKPSYTDIENYYKNNTVTVGCSCEDLEITKEWDDDLGTYYYFFECEKCGYYWEGPLYYGEEGPK